MALVKYNNNSISAVTSASSIPSGALTHIKTLTASSSATLSFVDGSSDVVFDGTYPIYVFKFINIHPATDNRRLTVGFRDGGTNYDATKTTTVFVAYHEESDGSPEVGYRTGEDLAQSTDFQGITGLISANETDANGNGELFLFNPSSTTFVKHFMATSNCQTASNESTNDYVAGYCNVTTAIDAVQFKMSSGNIDSGKIKLYGIKDS
jgi:hypothetical protein